MNVGQLSPGAVASRYGKWNVFSCLTSSGGKAARNDAGSESAPNRSGSHPPVGDDDVGGVGGASVLGHHAVAGPTSLDRGDGPAGLDDRPVVGREVEHRLDRSLGVHDTSAAMP